MRTHVEVDPAVELRSLEAIQLLVRDYSWAIDIQVCVFAQEGLTTSPETGQLLVRALERGAQVIGGAPYADADPRGQIDRVFALAADFDVDIDFHLDLTEDQTLTQLGYVCAKTRTTGYEGRVAVGHVTQLALLDPEAYERSCDLVASSGVAVTVLPSTDLYLMGRAATHTKPRGVAPLDGLLDRGVACSVATNNVVNAFTPYGDGSLIRMANLYANVCHQGTDGQLARCLDLVTSDAARVVGAADYGIHVGAPADLIGLGAITAAQAVAEIAPTRWGVKAGVQTFSRARSVLIHP
jgi:cytosine deaminase